MKRYQLGKSDLWLTEIGLGCWIMGKSGWTNVRDEESIDAIHTAIELGINWLDTAEGYGEGHSEEIIGQALQDHNREELIIATKVSPQHLSREKLPEALAGSLRRLRTDYIDLYQVHWPNPYYEYAKDHPEVPLEETMETLLTEQQKGNIRHIGVSNFTVEQMSRALAVGRFDSLQPPYSLFFRHIEKSIVPFCIENDIGIVAYSPLAQGLLTGKFNSDNRPGPEDNRSRSKLFQSPTFEAALEAVTTVREIGKRYGRTSAQTAIRWVVQQPGITAAIVGGRNPQQVRENVGATGWELSAEDIEALSTVGDKVMSTLVDDDLRMWVS